MDMDLGMDIAGYSVANAGRPVDKNDGDVCKPFCGRQHRYPFVILYEAKTKKKFNLRETVTMLPRLL